MTKRIKLRTLLMGGFLTLLFVGLWGRVYWVQVANAAFWEKQARTTWMTTKTLPQERGTITDRSGNVLAAGASAFTLAVNPKLIHELDEKNPEWKLRDQIVSKIHNVLGKPEDEIRQSLDAKKENGDYLVQKEIRPEGWKMDKAVADRFKAFVKTLQDQTGKKNVGIILAEDQKRYYPNGSLASQILGYENKDNEAIMGLERSLNDQLEGSAGKITYEKDGKRTQLPDGKVEATQPVDGKNVKLTIDRDIQYYMEQAMREAYEKYHPVSMTAIAADPKTMDILGMVSLPDFDPNHYWLYKDQSAFKNNAVQSVYEPGSTFKIVTLAAAVQEGLFDPNDHYMSGSISISSKDKPIRDVKRGGWGNISYLDGLKHSSNVAFVKLGYEKLGKEKFRQYITNFGFSQKTGIDLPGEVLGNTRMSANRDLAAATFGQAVTVTPIQQVAAVAAVANGGKLMVPHIVKEISDPNTGEKQVFEPKMVRQVISEETSRKVGEYLEQVVSDQNIGTGKSAYIPGYRIAGKTGTAQTVVGKDYSTDRFVVSFIGYAPVEDPKIVLYVLVDQPQDDLAGGGKTVGPIFKQIMEQSLKHMGILPKLTQEEAKQQQEETKSDAPVTAKVPDVSGDATTTAKTKLASGGFEAVVLGKGAKVLGQLPEAGSVLPTSQQVYLLTEKTLDNVPSLKGLALRDALEMCALLGGACTVQGEGYVTAQHAERTNGKLTIALTLAPPLSAQDASASDDPGATPPSGTQTPPPAGSPPPG
ncbi:penicillin-binding transpeptidase domain-containing protein [Cohnella nanjingensis]|uniref:Stage V sporulation protein D n=1 Tax=Cohnella nanjingensis TaxID=1387779 RepID=A0A7X0VGU6_9BACL|nr:penicillin-binding transpeptidase domain-containing protein [Cohnella nanjingensis]MBB6673226.1 stage V sporulation protein D [Cohnella nanjingensis]